jgi:hypothetical protein
VIVARQCLPSRHRKREGPLAIPQQVGYSEVVGVRQVGKSTACGSRLFA